jgi:hypothetical protein
MFLSPPFEPRSFPADCPPSSPLLPAGFTVDKRLEDAGDLKKEAYGLGTFLSNPVDIMALFDKVKELCVPFYRHTMCLEVKSLETLGSGSPDIRTASESQQSHKHANAGENAGKWL